MDDGLAFFGLDGATGGYLLTGGPAELMQLALGEELNKSHLGDLQARLSGARPKLGVVDAVHDVGDLAQTGWGVIYAATIGPDVKEALRELVALRREQATRRDPRFYQEYVLQPNETKRSFLRAHGVAPSGSADPEQMPYYLLLVGGPEAIPYSFQYQLDVQYAVGRIHFATVEEYAQYARSVVAAEQVGHRPRRVTFFGTSHPDDRPTTLSAARLVTPLAEWARARQAAEPEAPAWDVETVIGDDADKGRLARLLGGDTPALLFTAGHGMGFPSGDPRQREYQGALVCQEWPGPVQWRGDVPHDFYLAGDDVGDDARLLGLVAFHFACFGAGTPRLDDYPQLEPASPARGLPLELGLSRPIAPSAFTARLPQRLLGHPRGGALAVIGHVERALGSSFLWDGDDGGLVKSSVGPYQDALQRLMRGVPVGAALEGFNQRYAELTAELTDALRQITQSAKTPDAAELARLWMGSADARGFVVFGDPAVRLGSLLEPGARAPEAAISPVELGSSQPVAATAAASGEGSGSPPVPAATAANTSPTPGPSGASAVRVEVDPASGRIQVVAEGFAQAPPRAARGDDDVAYGLRFGGGDDGALDDLRSSLVAGLKTAADQLTAALGRLAGELTTLEVATFVSEDGDDLAGIEYDADSNRFVGPVRCRALTRVRLDGKTAAIVPAAAGVVDERLWAIHAEMVAQAQGHRAELLKAAATAASGLLGALRPS